MNTVADWMPWVNALLIPNFAMLMRMNSLLSSIEATKASHEKRLDRLEDYRDSRHA